MKGTCTLTQAEVHQLLASKLSMYGPGVKISSVYMWGSSNDHKLDFDFEYDSLQQAGVNEINSSQGLSSANALEPITPSAPSKGDTSNTDPVDDISF